MAMQAQPSRQTKNKFRAVLGGLSVFVLSVGPPFQYFEKLDPRDPHTVAAIAGVAVAAVAYSAWIGALRVMRGRNV